jgi:subtilisin-like proprotein convertase family protein
MKPLCLLCLLPLTAHGATYLSGVQQVNAPIPDNDRIGLSAILSVVAPITSIEEVEVSLDMANGWGGDLYCYLIHNDGIAVLLNRVGRGQDTPSGAGNNHLTVTLADSAATDVHAAVPTTGTLSGTFQPDGRNVDPSNSLDTTPRTAKLSAFNGMNANGDWTLFVADVASGETMTLNTWSMTIIGVPEPSSAVLFGAAAGLLIWRRRRE